MGRGSDVEDTGTVDEEEEEVAVESVAEENEREDIYALASTLRYHINLEIHTYTTQCTIHTHSPGVVVAPSHTL